MRDRVQAAQGTAPMAIDLLQHYLGETAMLEEKVEIHPGVFRRWGYNSVVYTGSAEALVAAGIVLKHQLPGHPGNPRTMCTFMPNGQRSGRGAGTYGKDVPGRKRVFAERDGTFTVSVQLDASEIQGITDARIRATSCWPFPVVFGTAFQHTSARGLGA